MADAFFLDLGQSVQSETGVWYRNLQLLGTGGNAVTFLVVATSGPHRGVPFALKVFRRLSKPERRDNFLAEMRFLRQCDHPSIMRVFDSGTFQDRHPFFVAEYLPDTLENVIRAGELPVAVKVSCALQLLSALTYLASRNPPVVHRDIKPQNVFLKGRSCVLGDFGLMKLLDQSAESEDREVLKESVGLGMPWRHRSPDQVLYLQGQRRLTTTTDVFQLGLVLAELFTDRNPEKPAAAVDPVELEPLGRIGGFLAGPISSVLARMLTLNPDERETADRFLPPWEGIFRSAVERAHSLEGRAFW
jgi:serine/threonine protein kinase